ncbi:hypothetical protein SAMN05216421_0496 [Halopseudomonas xinjiangensis]|uniref:DUF2288 domain-containing protein n=1 Tax=Halopseudomonas xinjiangensis TaxID=487184 RepID=A0A1H1MM88_9GAMM|nr:hypothetical protein SAMN05216421_0496 [Halopseudomonas xinjiangensis]
MRARTMQGNEMIGQDDTYAAIVGATGRIEWKSLEPHFARGELLWVDPRLDLVGTAEALIKDDRDAVAGWMERGLLGQLKDDQAADWHQRDPDSLWAVVIRPWVLVQERSAD